LGGTVMADNTIVYDSITTPSGAVIVNGSVVKLGRFETETWEVHYGWYSENGNREKIGWYLVSSDNEDVIKSLQRIDLVDIYLIQN
jgi:hypothetical protein